MYLPTVNDWNNWNKLNKGYSTLVSDMPILNTLGILIALREWSLMERPPTRLEIRMFLYERGIEGPNPWQLILPSEPITERTREKSAKGLDAIKSTEHLVFKELEERGLISSETFKSFRELNQLPKNTSENPRIQERIVTSTLHGRELLYKLTPKGSTYLEVMIQKPWYYSSLVRDAARRGFTTASILSWVYLKDPRRTEEYISNFPEMDSIISKMKFENYAKMLTPITRILVEFRELTKTIDGYERGIEFDINDRESRESFHRIFDLNAYKYDPLRGMVFEEFKRMAEAYLEMIISDAKKMGLDLEMLKKHAPPG